MVISHKYRYVYVQCMKTASSAMAAELCELYDGEQILEKHATIESFRQQASEDEKTYFSFAGVRNPLDVAVSRYELRKVGRNQKIGGHPAERLLEQTSYIEENQADFNQFFFEFMIARYPRRYDIGIVPADWASDSFDSIDHIYHYEKLQEEFTAILRKLNIEQQRALPLLNKTRKDSDYLQYYDQRTLRLACSLFGDYMQRWGYPFPPGIEPRPEFQIEVQRLVALRQRLEQRPQNWLGRLFWPSQSQLDSEIIEFLDDLLSPPNPVQRIE